MDRGSGNFVCGPPVFQVIPLPLSPLKCHDAVHLNEREHINDKFVLLFVHMSNRSIKVSAFLDTCLQQECSDSNSHMSVNFPFSQQQSLQGGGFNFCLTS